MFLKSMAQLRVNESREEEEEEEEEGESDDGEKKEKKSTSDNKVMNGDKIRTTGRSSENIQNFSKYSTG